MYSARAASSIPTRFRSRYRSKCTGSSHGCIILPSTKCNLTAAAPGAFFFLRAPENRKQLPPGIIRHRVEKIYFTSNPAAEKLLTIISFPPLPLLLPPLLL